MDTLTKWFFGLLLGAIVILQGLTIYLGGGLPNVNWPGWKVEISVWLAFFVGALGAWTFYLGVYTGFIGRSQRDEVLKFMPPIMLVAGYVVTGGIVAAIFQWAQPETFAPIQAFVLGATWPSVVTRLMSGDGVPPGISASDVRKLVDPAQMPPTQIPTPPSAAGPAAPRAEVDL